LSLSSLSPPSSFGVAEEQELDCGHALAEALAQRRRSHEHVRVWAYVLASGLGSPTGRGWLTGCLLYDGRPAATARMFTPAARRKGAVPPEEHPQWAARRQPPEKREGAQGQTQEPRTERQRGQMLRMNQQQAQPIQTRHRRNASTRRSRVGGTDTVGCHGAEAGREAGPRLSAKPLVMGSSNSNG
jgi:hypothetical protein